MASTFWLGASAFHALALSPEHDALLFLDSKVMPRKAAACSSRISGYSARFEPAFRTWLAVHKDQLVSGEAFLRADALKTKVPFEGDIQAVGATVSQQWGSAPLPVLQENCAALLEQLSEMPSGG